MPKKLSPFTARLIAALQVCTLPVSATPVISEFMASNRESLADSDSDYPDWIELSNPTGSPLALGGHFLTDDPDRPDRWPLPEITLAPGEHRVVFASGKDRSDPASQLHTNFQLNASGGSVSITAPDASTTVDSITYPKQFADISYGTGTSGGSTIALDLTPTDFSTSANTASQIRVSAGGGGTTSASWDTLDTLSSGALHQRYLWFDYSAALASVPAGFRVLSSTTTWTPDATPTTFGSYNSSLGIFPCPDSNNGIDTIFTGSVGSEITDYFAANTPLATTPISTATGPTPVSWDTFDLVSTWLANPADPRRGQFVVLNRDDPVFVRWPSAGPTMTAILTNAVSDEPDQLYFSTPTPGTTNGAGVLGFVADTKFSVDRGFHETAFELAITSATPGASIVYTTDGSDPTSNNGTLVPPPTPDNPPTATVQITTTTTVRARAIKQGFAASNADTHSYIFLDTTIHQPVRPAGFPTSWTVQPGDYEMDPRIVGPVYSEQQMKDALTEIPTVSVVLSLFDLFDRRLGIYSHPQSRGDQWERPASVEFIGFPDAPDAQFDCGLRINGRASRSPNRGKHNMRLAFRKRYGPAVLDFPLFGKERPSKINSVVLRGNNGDSWVNPGTVLRAQYIRDQWHRDAMEAMGHEQNAQGDYHLYINGLYWGLYHLFERMEGDWGEEHWGGDESDYDVIKDLTNNNVEAISGNTDAWRQTISLARRVNNDYSSYTPLFEFVDPAHLADYIALNFYSGNADWATSNWRALRHRSPGSSWHFICHDSERTDINAIGAGSNDPHGPVDNNTTGKNTPNMPDQLHQLLARSPEYRLKFADRVHHHYFNGGPLSPSGAAALWNSRAESIRNPLKAESARWGDRHRSPTATPDNYWQATLDYMNDSFFGDNNNLNLTRTDIVIGQLRRRRLYPTLDAPEFLVRGTRQHGGKISANTPITALNPGATGTVYYTTDGSDPRLIGGEPNPEAQILQPTQVIAPSQSVTINARILDDSDWSALSFATFLVGTPASSTNLAISELFYHPAENDPSPEFIELVNFSATTIDLSAVHFTNGIAFTFPTGTTLSPGDRITVSAGQFADGTSLNNGGETITLTAADGTNITSFRYNDRAPWPTSPDGNGDSLVLKNPATADPTLAGNWRPGTPSPGAPDPETTTYSSWKTANNISADSPATLRHYASGSPRPKVSITYTSNPSLSIEVPVRPGTHDTTVTLELSRDLRSWAAVDSEVTAQSKGSLIFSVDKIEAVEAAHIRARYSILAE